MREMKDSGIEWVGAIPQDWQLSKIGSLYTQRNEKVSDKDYQPLSVTMQGILPQLATAAKTDDGDNRKLVRVGDFAINSRSDRRGSCGISPLDGSVSLINIILTPRTAMHPGYYNWLFHTTLFADEFYKWGHGIVADLWTTRWQEMKSITVPVPEYAEQERIAAFLDAECAEIDTVLEKTRASIEEYKKLKHAVITQAVTKGVRGDRPMKDSGIEWIGDIPAEWSVVKQKYFWNTTESGVSVNAADKPVDNSEQYGVLKTSAVSKFMFIPTEHKQVNLEEYGRVSCPVRADSIIASRMNTPELVGACGYVQNNYPNLFLPDRLWQITFKDELSPKYAWYYLSGIRVRQYISSLSTGTSSSMQNISQSQYGNIFITIPSIGEQTEITKYLDEKCRFVDALVTKKQQYLTEIENYKNSLIYEYVTGKKEVHPL